MPLKTKVPYPINSIFELLLFTSLFFSSLITKQTVIEFPTCNFTTETGTFNNRTVSKFKNGAEAIFNDVIISSKNPDIKIKSQIDTIDKVFVYDILGRELYRNLKVKSNELLISDLKSQQILIIKVVLVSGKSITKKVDF